MPRNRKVVSESGKRGAPATTLEARENQLIALAVDLAAQQLSDGTASAQVISFYIKKGSTIERLEKEKLVLENELLKAKTQSLQSAKRVEDLYANALTAMKVYAMNPNSDEDDDQDV